MPSFSTLPRASRTLASSMNAPTCTTKRPPAAGSEGLAEGAPARIAAGDGVDAGGGNATCGLDAAAALSASDSVCFSALGAGLAGVALGLAGAAGASAGAGDPALPAGPD